MSCAIDLPATRYCTVTAMLSAGLAAVHRRYLIRRVDGRPDEGDEVVVTGPNDDPDTLSARSQLAEAQMTPGGRA